MTWFRQANGYRLYFNRDERRTRRPAVPPAVRSREGVRFVAPLDGDFGGSWLAVNEFGLCLGLLNGYRPRADPGDRDYTSRGLLLTALVDSPSADRALRRLADVELRRFRSFLLALVEPNGAGALATWSGRGLRVAAELSEEDPLVSSSFAAEEVRSNRRELFRRMRREGSAADRDALHLAFHSSHEPQAGPHSPCMHRPDARTVSMSRVAVGPETIRFDYVPHPPCEGGFTDPPLRLPRKPPSES